jgi:hypothetical protein
MNGQRKQHILDSIKAMSQLQVNEMCEWLLWLGTWYMEDKRRSKRTFCLEVVQNCFELQQYENQYVDNDEIENAFTKAINLK